MTDADISTAKVAAVARSIQRALNAVELEATGAELADALQLIAAQAAEKVAGPERIARTFLALAERYFERAQAGEGHSERPSTETAHGVLTVAAQAMRNAGLADAEIQQLMLGFTLAWLGRSNPAASAEILYRHADALAGRSHGVRYDA